MPYFKKDDINVLFIHIPKTGGTSIEKYFSKKFTIPLNNTSLYGFIKDETKKQNMKINSSLQHITYTQMIQFSIDFNNIKILTVVRNPYERIISDLFFYHKIKVSTSKESVFDIIKDYLVSTEYDNHNIPQHLFVTDENKSLIPTIKILKTETLTMDMIRLGYKDFNRVDQANKKKLNYYDYLNDASIKLINKFYHLDFILFHYNKIIH